MWYSHIPFLRMYGISQSAAGSKMTLWKCDSFFCLIHRTFRVVVLLCFPDASTDRPDFSQIPPKGSNAEEFWVVFSNYHTHDGYRDTATPLPLGAHITSSSHC